jgi:hypothetical protein
MSNPGTTQTSGAGYSGQAGLADGNDQFNAIQFLIEQALGALLRTSLPCRVVALHGGGIGAPPTVDVVPMINMIDGIGNSSPHGTVYGLPVFRLQAGTLAFVVDPVVGDIGDVVFASRDISLLKQSGAQSNPGSRRQFDWADGIYFGSILGKTPTVYIQLTANGINIVDANGNTIATSSSGIALTSPQVSTSSVLQAGNGASGTFTSEDGKTVTVMDGIVTGIT